MASLAQVFGYDSRLVAINGGGGHSVTEIYYDGAWHLFDADHDKYFLGQRGVASMDELLGDLDLIWHDGWRSLLETTTIVEYVPITQEGRLGSDYEQYPVADYAYHTATHIPWELYPGEKVDFYSEPGNMKAAKLSPYVDYGTPPNYARGVKRVKINLNGGDPRVDIQKNQLFLYVFSAYPLRGGSIEIKIKSTSEESFMEKEVVVSVIKGQQERLEFNIGTRACTEVDDGCLLRIDIEEFLDLIQMAGDDSLEPQPYPFLTLPKYYLRIQFKRDIALSDFESITGEVVFQVSKLIFPHEEYMGTYEYRDLNPESDKDVVVSFDN